MWDAAIVLTKSESDDDDDDVEMTEEDSITFPGFLGTRRRERVDPSYPRDIFGGRLKRYGGSNGTTEKTVDGGHLYKRVPLALIGDESEVEEE